MSFMDDEFTKRRIERLKKEFDELKKPSKHLTKQDLVNSFIKKQTNQK